MLTFWSHSIDSLNFASVYGLKQGTNLHGQDYSWLGLSFPTSD